MPTTQNIVIDLNTRGANPVAFSHQGDTARSFVFEVYNNGAAFSLTGYTAKIAAMLPADKGYHVIAGENMATGTISDNTITATLPAEFTAKPGHGVLTIILTGSGASIRPINIDFRIQKSADAPETIAGASDFIPILEQYMADDMATYINAWLDDHPDAAAYYITGSKLVVDSNGILSLETDTDDIVEALDLGTLRSEVDDLKSDLESVESGVFEYRKKTQTLNVTATSIAASTHIMDVSIAAGMRYRIKIDDPSGIVNNHVLTVYRANSSGDRTSLGSLTTGLVYEFTAPESEAIAYFTAYKSANTLTPPGNLVTTCEYMTSDSQDSIERHVQNLERQAGDKSAIKSVAYESGSLNLPLDYYESEGKTIEILPSGSFKSTVTTLYLRYAGAESNTNLGNIAVGEKTYVRLPTTIEKVIVYSSSANAGTITLAVRTVGVKDSIETYGNILKGKKLNYLGDSITYGGAYTPFTTYLTNVYDCIARNYGIAGSTIQYDADRNPMSVRYADMDDDTEIVACMGGTNDYWNNLPLGQMGDTTYNTYYGALDVLIRGMIAKYPTAFFYMVTPPHGYNGGNFDGEAKSNAGSMQDIANAVKEVSAKYGVPVLDVFNEGGLYPKIQEQYDAYYADGVHLNNAGQQKLAQMHYKFIESHYMGAVPTVLVPSAP